VKKGILIVIIAIPVVFFSYIASQITDTDGDEVTDLFDNCPDKLNPNQEDLDADNQGDVCDFDDDNDGIVDGIDAFQQNPEEWDDFDFDGIGANEDEDDDNDGIPDISDSSPSPISSQLITKHLDLVENCAIMDPGFPRQLCYSDFFVSLIKKGESSADVMNLAFFFSKLYVIHDCHFTAHNLGYAAFEENPVLTENLMNAVGTCRNGFHHGVLSAFFDDLKKEGEDISNWYKVACDEFVDTENYYPCIHGIGHGLVFVYENDLGSSVDACYELPDEPLEHCMNGVMMQYSDYKLTKSTSWEKDIPKICSEIELITPESIRCYSQIGRTLAFLTNHDLDKSLEFCATLSLNNEFYCETGVLRELLEAKWQRDNAEVSFN